jgi:REP element-mobilizing transposase RayT
LLAALEQQVVRWYHLILSAYGFWLPNDPRGSWSQYVGSRKLYYYGPATKVEDKRSYAHDPHDLQKRLKAKQSLKHPRVRFDAPSRAAISQGFNKAITEGGYEILACYIGRDHCHLITARHSRTIEQIAKHLKSRATMSLNASAGKFPSSPWAEGCWSVFIDDPKHLGAAIDYVNHHPQKENLPAQTWPFLSPIPV